MGACLFAPRARAGCKLQEEWELSMAKILIRAFEAWWETDVMGSAAK